MTNEPSDICAEVNARLAECMTRILANGGDEPMASDAAQDEFLELVICGNKLPAVANFLHEFYDSGAPVISCRIDSLVTEGAVSEVFCYDFAEPLKKALFACRAGYFVNRDGQWLNGHGESFESSKTNSVYLPRRDASRGPRTQTRRINLVGLKRRPG